MTSKQRAFWRAKANKLVPLFQVGKGGISENLIEQTNEALTARELIKLRVLLDTCPEKPKEIANTLAEKTGSDVIQVVGGSIVLYRYNPDLHE